jgi:hypothetical protein
LVLGDPILRGINVGRNRNFWIIEKFLDVSQLAEIQVKNIINLVDMFTSIFQNQDENIQDNRRRIYQPPIEWIKDESINLIYCLNHVFKFCEQYFGDLSLSPMSLLLSLPGCAEQQPHTDFDLNKSLKGALKSRILIVALMDKTRIVTYDNEGYHRKEITIPKGGLFIGRGSLIHNGAAYESTNLRIHFYLDCKRNSRLPNKVYNVFWHNRNNKFKSLRGKVNYLKSNIIKLDKAKVNRLKKEEDSRRKSREMKELRKLRR